MAAMKPRTGDGPLEVTKEGRGVIMRVPLEGGGRLVVEMTQEEADTLSKELENLAKLPHYYCTIACFALQPGRCVWWLNLPRGPVSIDAPH